MERGRDATCRIGECHMGVAYAGVGARGLLGFGFGYVKKGGGLEGSQGADPKDEDCEDGEGEADGVEV